MWCLACEQFCRMVLCGSCIADSERGPDVTPRPDLLVRPAFLHEGAPRVLVSRLKYQGIEAIANLFAAELLRRVPASTKALVPVPRVLTRRLKYGTDPARVLATAIGRRLGIPVVNALAAPVWASPSAGRRLGARKDRSFYSLEAVEGWLLVDDVVTSGATLAAAQAQLGTVGLGAVTATASL